MAVIFGTRREPFLQIFLHSHYEIFHSTGARRPFDEKPSCLGSWVSTPLRPLTQGKCFLLFLPDFHSAYYDSFVYALGWSLPPSLGLSRICCTWTSFWWKRREGWAHPPALAKLGEMALGSKCGISRHWAVWLALFLKGWQNWQFLIAIWCYCHYKREAMGMNPKPCRVDDSKHWEWVRRWWAWYAQWLWFLELEKRGKLPLKPFFSNWANIFHYEIFRSTGARRPFDEKPSCLGSWGVTYTLPVRWF